MPEIWLDHVQLAIPAGGEEECRKFWGDLLGLPELPKPVALAKRGGVWFRHGNGELHLGVEENFQPAHKAHPGFVVQDISALAARLTEAGYDIRWDDAIKGRERFFMDDPFGNRLEFIGHNE